MIGKKCSHGESFLSCQVNIVFEIPLPATRCERPLCDWKTTDRCEHFITREKGFFRPGGTGAACRTMSSAWRSPARGPRPQTTLGKRRLSLRDNLTSAPPFLTNTAH